MPSLGKLLGLDSVTSEESGEDRAAGGPQSGTGFAGEATTTVPSSRGTSGAPTIDSERFVPRGVLGRGGSSVVDPRARSGHPARSGDQDPRAGARRGDAGDQPVRRRGPDHGAARAPEHRPGLRVRGRPPRAAVPLHAAHRGANARRGPLSPRRLAARPRPPRRTPAGLREDVRRGVVRAQPRHHPPRSQAHQRDDQRLRAGLRPRLGSIARLVRGPQSPWRTSTIRPERSSGRLATWRPSRSRASTRSSTSAPTSSRSAARSTRS